MTLIIGRVKDGKVYMLGDTELTFRNQKKANPFVEGCLKQYLINDDLAIGFAGTKEHFEQTLPRLLDCSDSHDVVKIALDVQLSGLNFDLMIGEIGYEKIRFVRNGVVSEAEAGFIGSHEAFDAFQKIYHKNSSETYLQLEVGRAQFQILRLPEPITDDEIYSRLFHAFKGVIWDTNVSGVGGVIIPLCTDKGRFRYINYVDITSDSLNIEDFIDEPKKIEFGTAVGGGYSVEFSDDTPYDGQGRNIGFYFLQGGFGIVFPANKNGLRNAELVKAKNPAFWILETAKRFGDGIASGCLSVDHCGIAGEEFLKLEKYQDALFCYQIVKDLRTLEERPAVCDRYIAGYATAMFNCGKHQEAITMLQAQVNKQSASPGSIAILQKVLQTISSFGAR